MKALVVKEVERLELQDITRPAINDYQALVRVEVCGVCGSTDWKIIRGQMPWAGPFPLILGHESVGRVVEIGSKVRKFKVGDRVTRPIVPPTPQLNSAFGGFAEFGVVTDAQAMADDGDASLLEDYNAQRQIVVPTDLDPVHAALAISLAETASGLIDLPNLRGLTVVVAGTGVAGLTFTRWAKLAGARVATLGRRAERLALAERFGADHVIDTRDPDWRSRLVHYTSGAADGAIEAVGDVALAEQIVPALKPNAFAAAYGAPPDGQSYGCRWVAMNVREHLSYAWVVDLIRRNWLGPSTLISSIVPFDYVTDLLDAANRGELVKAFVRVSPS